jgi:glycosyltransferase involved in cell wall biosynthesis
MRLPAHVRVLVVGGEATAHEDHAFAGEIERRIGAERLAPRVTITGHCPEDEVSAHLLAADMAALPFSDGASFRRGSLLAALAHGLPTITTFPHEDQRPKTKDERLNSFRPSSFVLRPLVDGENVLLVPPGDAGALAEAIALLEGDAALRARLAEGGRALAGQFSWETIAARHEKLYRRMARG